MTWGRVPLSSWPDLFRPSTPRRPAWPIEMPGTSPGKTMRVVGLERSRAQSEIMQISQAGHEWYFDSALLLERS